MTLGGNIQYEFQVAVTDSRGGKRFYRSSDSSPLQPWSSEVRRLVAWHHLADFWELQGQSVPDDDQDAQLGLEDYIRKIYGDEHHVKSHGFQLMYSPAPLILVGDGPRCICRDAMSLVPFGDMFPACPQNPVTMELMFPGTSPQLPSPQEPSLGWDHGFCFAYGKRGPSESRLERVPWFLIDGAEDWGPFLPLLSSTFCFLNHRQEGSFPQCWPWPPLWYPWGRLNTCPASWLASVPWSLEASAEAVRDLRAVIRHFTW